MFSQVSVCPQGEGFRSLSGASVWGVSFQGGFCQGNPLYSYVWAIQILIECILVKSSILGYFLKLYLCDTNCSSKVILIATHVPWSPTWKNRSFSTYICLTSLTRAKCGIPSTLCWKIPNMSGSIELFAL